MNANEWTVIVKPPVSSSVSWWLNLNREQFREQAEIEWIRMAKRAGDPVVRSIRPLLLGGKLP